MRKSRGRTAQGIEVASLHKIFKRLGVVILVNLIATLCAVIAFGIGTHEGVTIRGFQATSDKMNFLYEKLQETESAQRGYIITSNEGYLANFHTLANDSRTALRELQATPSSPKESTYIDEIAQLSNQKLSEMDETVTTLQEQGAPAASVLVGVHRGANIMNKIKTAMGAAMTAVQKDVTDARHFTEFLSSCALVLLLIALLGTIGTARWLYLLFKNLKDANRSLVSINKSKDEFLAIASHQLRTPATAVKQYVSMALEGFVGELTPAQVSVLEKANANNERQIAIINDILQVAKLELKELKLKIRSHDMNALARQALRDSTSKSDAAKHDVTFRASKNPAMVAVDEHLVRSVLDNLIDNAIKYTPDGGNIRVRVSERDKTVRVTVADNGVGIAPSDHDKLFKKFARVENPLSISAGGTGLGLYWAYEIVKLHGGHISLTSSEGKGTTFTVVLPTKS